ncbi:MAG TPA: MarC family NAAT transporter [Steroidobacteraceae bacterium]|jgi:multiple antibiotic resistance protein|nr:MarC family NAAT transporter [Steroidobacteraceae bacterium]
MMSSINVMELTKTFLLAFGALFSIVNPLSGAFIFFGATRELEPRVRGQVSRWVAIYAFCIVAASLYIGAYVLSFFGISIPVLRVAGGIVVAMAGWRMLNEPDATEQRRSETPSPRTTDVSPSRLAFYPLTMPLTTGPGTISVAISLGANRPHGFHVSSVEFFVETLAAVVLLAVLVYLFYRNSARLAGWIGVTGTTIVVRLSAFLLLCIGVQVLWNGLAELLSTLPLGTGAAS